MSGTTIKLDTKRLDELIAQMPQRANEIVKSTAFSVQGRAQQAPPVGAPIDTGALSTGIHSEEQGPLTWWVMDSVDYGIYQEMGFHHWISGKFIQNPFMVPAIEWARPQYEKAWQGLFK